MRGDERRTKRVRWGRERREKAEEDEADSRSNKVCLGEKETLVLGGPRALSCGRPGDGRANRLWQMEFGTGEKTLPSSPANAQSLSLSRPKPGCLGASQGVMVLLEKPRSGSPVGQCAPARSESRLTVKRLQVDAPSHGCPRSPIGDDGVSIGAWRSTISFPSGFWSPS